MIEQETDINEENYFEYAEAIYCFAVLNYGGQDCPMYSILSMSAFKPGPSWSESEVERENFHYCEISESNIERLNDQLLKFMETRELVNHAQ